MKKSISTLLYTLIFIGLFSCDQELTEEVKGNLSVATLTTEKDAVALVNGIYGSLLADGWNYYGNGILIELTDGITDVHRIGEGTDLDAYLWQNENIGSDLWSSIYSTISKANWAIKLINNMDENVFEDEETKNRLLGEAHFLRGLGYFDLVGLFGGVPLLTVPVESDVPGFPRSSASDVYAQIESDFQVALNNLPNTAIPGKASLGAALGLMAKAQLRQGKWENANTYLDELIGLGTYDLYTEGSYLELFFESRNTDNEFIFAVMSLGESYDVASNHHIKRFTPWVYDFGWGGGGMPITLYNSIEDGDERKEVYLDDFPLFFGGNDSAIRRFGVAINRKYGTFNRDITAPGSGYAGYQNYGISKLNVPVLRYADVLLLKADVENELNGGPNAIAYNAINEVRNRSGLQDLTPGLSQQEFRDAVLKERAIELALEGHRKDDLIRHNLFETVMTQYLIDQGYPISLTVTSDYQLLPIPRTELDLNPNLEPNPSNNF
ncbi:RagB/SusD family nutrient uptake outer membrane protein [Abyssalbus ytuae]|uniref:RagB/SusD family nutrient uptake outer membrane protein n=1 Tax=Abyssalbus ytuae TaxID=2926907 RepID=A0A9E7CXX8_9FLAO|nr:RagB/SusD family nutrient uptake outer membrane protein [Abyssalbus ytuae]UOB16045.1 RagB/SusD family nutrient uptake outer membrane protein [Abyssalbus ytuae]